MAMLLSLKLAIALDNGLGRSGPAMGWSSWNHFGNNGSHCHCKLGADGLMEIADAMVATGLKDAGYRYINQDGGWAIGRDNVSGKLIADPYQFPNGVKPVVDYIHSKGMLFGIYTDRGSTNCRGVKTGSDSFEKVDAEQWAEWGVDYVKDDSCGGVMHGTVWQQYARMRDALNATGRPMWYSITQMLDYDDGRDAMHCIGDGIKRRWGAFTLRPWVYEGLDPTTLANSYLAEYCNNKVAFGSTGGRGGFLSQLDAQQLLTWDNLTVAGAYSDMDILQVGNSDHGVTPSLAESRAQLSTFAILSSPLILGNDPRNMSDAICDLVTNAEIIALNQDRLVSRARLVYQYPTAEWPGAGSVPANGSGYPPSTAAAAAATAAPSLAPFKPPAISLQAWAKPMADGSVGVVIFNRAPSPSPPLNLTWAMVGLARGANVRVRDLWRRETLPGNFSDYVPVGPIPKHDAAALRLHPQ